MAVTTDVFTKRNKPAPMVDVALASIALFGLETWELNWFDERDMRKIAVKADLDTNLYDDDENFENRWSAFVQDLNETIAKFQSLYNQLKVA
jgi:hypothetical protein